MIADPDEVAFAPVTALDTSFIIAGLLTWHERHPTASAVLATLLESQALVILPLHALAEAYSVMTRLPPPHRLGPRDAFQVLERSLKPRSTIVGLDGEEGWRCLEDLVQLSIVGGTTYDGFILAAARKGGATRILTLNPAHFERLAGEEIEIAVP